MPRLTNPVKDQPEAVVQKGMPIEKSKSRPMLPDQFRSVNYKDMKPYEGKDAIPSVPAGQTVSEPRFFVNQGRKVLAVYRHARGGIFRVGHSTLSSNREQRMSQIRVLREAGIPGV